MIHLDGELATAAAEILPRLTGETKLIAVLPRSNLAAVVDIMQSSERIAGMMAAENFDSRQLSAMATRVIAGDIFGLEKMVMWGTQVHSQLVGLCGGPLLRHSRPGGAAHRTMDSSRSNAGFCTRSRSSKMAATTKLPMRWATP